MVNRGKTQAFTATVAGMGNPSQTVTWSVTGGGSGTSITSGVLTVSASESATSLTVRATSTYDTAKFGTATIMVTKTGQGVTLIYPEDAAAGVGAFPDNITLSKSGAGGKPTEQTLTVSGEYDSYRWRVNGTIKGNGKTIELKAADYKTGTHQISVEVTRDGGVYSRSGTFKVES
jgi:hypothetical protein